jgi:hypothetical protein
MYLAFYIILAAITIWTSMILDILRLQRYFKSIGGKIIKKKWNPFVGVREREYIIKYEDKEGKICDVNVKTSLMGTYILTD